MKIAISRQGSPSTHLNIELASQDQAFGKRDVAFILPGGPGAPLLGYQSYRCLEEVVDLVFHDPRGCGQSDKGDPSSYTMDNYIDDVEAIREHLGLDRIHVIGKSYGSMCALGYALRYPARTNKLVLAAGSSSWRFIEHAKKNIKRIGTPEQIEIVKKLWTGGFANKEEILTYFKLTQTLYSVKANTHPAPLETLEFRADNIALPVLNEGFKNEFWHFDYDKQLPDVACKTLILGGREDWINDITLLQYMADHIPRCQLIIFDKASHAMEVDVMEEFFQRMADFLVTKG